MTRIADSILFPAFPMETRICWIEISARQSMRFFDSMERSHLNG